VTTFGDLINEVHLNLLGYVLDQEQLTPVSSDFTSTATSFSVQDASQISPGLIEVDEELMWCREVDPDSNIVYVTTRGIYGTTAAAHTAGAFTRNQPKFPRASIQKAINSTIRSTYPDLFAVATTALTADPVAVGYGIPADVEEVLDVFWQQPGVSDYWVPVRRYRVNMKANVGSFPTGKSIDVMDGVVDGMTIQVVYRTVPTAMSALTDEFTTVTGLNESAAECIVYGACARLVGYTEAARMSDDAAEARFIDGQPAGQALNAARYFY
jgi:hypothetical protein